MYGVVAGSGGGISSIGGALGSGVSAIVGGGVLRSFFELLVNLLCILVVSEVLAGRGSATVLVVATVLTMGVVSRVVVIIGGVFGCSITTLLPTDLLKVVAGGSATGRVRYNMLDDIASTADVVSISLTSAITHVALRSVAYIKVSVVCMLGSNEDGLP